MSGQKKEGYRFPSSGPCGSSLRHSAGFSPALADPAASWRPIAGYPDSRQTSPAAHFGSQKRPDRWLPSSPDHPDDSLPHTGAAPEEDGDKYCRMGPADGQSEHRE